MAERRCIAKTICLSDAFLDMPYSARCLYFTLLLNADDDGFVNNPKSLMRITGAVNDDMNILISKKFVLIFESGVIVIKHWRIHNTIKNDRYVETKYKEEKACLELDENKAYTQINGMCIQNGPESDPQINLIKDNLIKGKLNMCESKRFTKPTIEQIQSYINEKGYSVDAERFFDFYESKGWMVGKNKMKDWKACVRTWQGKEKPKQTFTLDEMNVEEQASNLDFDAIRSKWKSQ